MFGFACFAETIDRATVKIRNHTMRILTIAWILVAVTWCCDSAVIYEPVVQNTRYYEPRIQDLELLDVSPL